MKNQSGFAHWVIVILISIMAVGLVGAAWYYETKKDTNTVITYPTKEECESKTGCQCDVLLCDYKCPKNFKEGWACNKSITNKNTNSLTSISSDPLLTVESHGGLCSDEKTQSRYGCNKTYTLFASGHYTLTSQIGEEIRTLNEGKEDSIKENRITDLQKLIKDTNFSQLRNTPFTDTCPTAYDGQEIIYTFYLNDSKTERIATCEYVVDQSDPLISRANELSETAKPHTD